MKESTTVNLACGASRCTYRITLQVETDLAHPYGLAGTHVHHALQQAATYLGWRSRVDVHDSNKSVVCCPFHAKELVCKRCAVPTHECTCMGGPRWEAIP
jgi:hypothetical protein